MPVCVEVTYDMSKELGTPRFDIEATTVGEALETTRQRFDDVATFERLAGRVAIAVNGVLVRHRKRLQTPLADGDTMSFVKAAAGG